MNPHVPTPSFSQEQLVASIAASPPQSHSNQPFFLIKKVPADMFHSTIIQPRIYVEKVIKSVL